MSNKKWIITGSVVVAAVIGYVAMQGPKLGNEGTPGAIGAANVYKSEQIGSGDVSLDNAQVATFIQSDVFRKLATDESFREAARSESFNRFLDSDALREASAKVDVAAVLSDASFKELLKTEAFAKAIEDGSLREALAEIDLAKLTEGNRLAELLRSDALRELAMREDFHRFAQEAFKREAASIADLNKVAESFGTLKESAAFKTLEGNQAFEDALKEGFLSMFRTAEGSKFAIEGLRELAEMSAFSEAARMEGFAQVAEGIRAEDLGAVRDISSSPEMLSVLSSEAYREAAARAELGMVVDAGLKDALARVSE